MAVMVLSHHPGPLQEFWRYLAWLNLQGRAENIYIEGMCTYAVMGVGEDGVYTVSVWESREVYEHVAQTVFKRLAAEVGVEPATTEVLPVMFWIAPNEEFFDTKNSWVQEPS